MKNEVTNENWINDYSQALNALCGEYPAYLDMHSLKECQPVILNSLVKKYFSSAKIFNILGMQRAGNHIISHWFLNNSNLSTVYINNATTYPGLADSVRIFNCTNFHVKHTDRVICTYENIAASKLNGLDFRYIIRDPYNWLASWVSHSEFDEETVENQIETYLYNAENCKDFIVYNKWVSSRDYRDKVADSLGFINNDLEINHVPAFGSGSSFDSHTFEGRGSQMKLFERWKSMSHNPKYNLLVEKYGVQFKEISEEICGFPSPF